MRILIRVYTWLRRINKIIHEIVISIFRFYIMHYNILKKNITQEYYQLIFLFKFYLKITAVNSNSKIISET